MITSPLHKAASCLAKLGARLRDVGHVGRTGWSDASTTAIRSAQEQVKQAEQEDANAETLISQIMADGKVDDAEVPLLARALEHVRKSRELDAHVAN